MAVFATTLLGAFACVASDRAPSADTLAAQSTSPAAGATSSGLPTTTAPDSMAVAVARDSVLQARNAPVPLPIAEARVEVELATRKLRLYRGDSLVATHSVAIGSAEWPTRTGEWDIVQVVWNPEWTPPDESWAEEREPRESGDPNNPLGHAQLVYDLPRSVHGTNDPKSIGKAVSHGSIRVTNTVAKKLARELMEITGVVKDEAWYRETQARRSVKQIVDLPQRVPIRVY